MEPVQVTTDPAEHRDGRIAEKIDAGEKTRAVLLIQRVGTDQPVEALPPCERAKVRPLHPLRPVLAESLHRDVEICLPPPGVQGIDIDRDVRDRLEPAECPEEELPRLPDRDPLLPELLWKKSGVRGCIERRDRCDGDRLVVAVAVDRIMVGEKDIGLVFTDDVHKPAQRLPLSPPLLKCLRGGLRISEIHEIQEVYLGTQHASRLFSLARAEDPQFLVKLRSLLVLPPLPPGEQHRVCTDAEFQPVVRQRRPVFVVRMSRNIHQHAVLREVEKSLAQIDGLLLGPERKRNENRQ